MYICQIKKVPELVKNLFLGEDKVQAIYFQGEVLGHDISLERAVEIMRGRLQERWAVLISGTDNILLFENINDLEKHLIARANDFLDDYNETILEYGNDSDSFFECIKRNLLPSHTGHELSVLAHCMNYEMILAC